MMILEDYCGTTMGGSFHAKIEDEENEDDCKV